MRKDFSPHWVSSWMTDQEAEAMIKARLISNGGKGPVILLVEPSPQPIPKGETSSPDSWSEPAKRVARTSH